MSERPWSARTPALIGAGLFLLAGFVAVLALAFYAGRSKGHAEGEQAAQTSYYAETARREIERYCLGLPAADLPECIEGVVRASREEQRAEDDLIAQNGAARWGGYSLMVSVAGAFVSVAGLIALFISLGQTRQAIKDTREIGEAQVRAYPVFAVDRVDITGTENRREVEVAFIGRVTNTGESPAYGISFRMDIQYVTGTAHSEMRADGEGMFETGTSLNTLAAGQHVMQKLVRRVQADISKVRSGEAGFRLAYVTRYIDVFGKEQLSPIVSGTTGIEGSEIIWMPDVLTALEDHDD